MLSKNLIDAFLAEIAATNQALDRKRQQLAAEEDADDSQLLAERGRLLEKLLAELKACLSKAVAADHTQDEGWQKCLKSRISFLDALEARDLVAAAGKNSSWPACPSPKRRTCAMRLP